jgi:hypothetical protein
MQEYTKEYFDTALKALECSINTIERTLNEEIQHAQHALCHLRAFQENVVGQSPCNKNSA